MFRIYDNTYPDQPYSQNRGLIYTSISYSVTKSFFKQLSLSDPFSKAQLYSWWPEAQDIWPGHKTRLDNGK